MRNRPTLPALGQISITALKLSPELQAELEDVGILSVGHLFRATETQQTLIRKRLTHMGIRELVVKTTRFYRIYRRVKSILEKAEENQNKPPTEKPLSKDRQSANWEVDYNRIPIDVLVQLSRNPYHD